MAKRNISEGFSIKEPVLYQIKVQGNLGENFSDKLGGMQITVERVEDKIPVSILVGKVRDQAALVGILNTLYDLHMFIISVNLLVM